MGWAPVITSLSFFCVSFFAGKWKGKSAARGMTYHGGLSYLFFFWFCSLIKLRHGGYHSPPRPAPSALGGLVENICLCDGHLFSWGSAIARILVGTGYCAQ